MDKLVLMAWQGSHNVSNSHFTPAELTALEQLTDLIGIRDQAFLFSKVYLARRLDSDLVGVVQYGGE